MFARFVQVRIDPAMARDISTLYAQRIIPALLETPGCMYCGLAQDAAIPREVISLTFWASEAHAKAYEKSGLFRTLYQESQPYLENATEWAVRLSEDIRLRTASPEPDVEAYREVTAPESTQVSPAALEFRHLRLGTYTVQTGMENRFADLFHTEVIPLIRTMEGCRYVQLSRNVTEPNRFVAITVWVSGEAAAACDRQKMFERVITILRPTLSDLSQWKLDLRPADAARTATSQDIGVRSYVLLTGRAGGLS